MKEGTAVRRTNIIHESEEGEGEREREEASREKKTDRAHMCMRSGLDGEA